MADRITDNADLAVDELRRKGRRRLVGAVVIALAAAVLVPMLLEKDPKPLGDEVSIQIPPIDSGKFVNRLNAGGGDNGSAPSGPAAKAPADLPPANERKTDKSAAPAPSPDPLPASPAPPVVSPPGKSIAEAEQRVLAPASRPTVPPEAKAAPEVKPAPEAKSPPPAATEAKPAASAAKAEPKTTATNSGKADGYAVQLAAFSDDKGANALAGKLKRAGYAAFVEPVQTSRGTLWRVRVGGYATRVEADAARVKLKGEGYNGIVAANK